MPPQRVASGGGMGRKLTYEVLAVAKAQDLGASAAQLEGDP